MAFEQMKIGDWLIEVDRAATQAAYLHEPPISACSCIECQNYYAACLAGKAHSSEASAFFQKLGISPEKEAEVYMFYANEQKTHGRYGGFYHLVGRLIAGPGYRKYIPIDDQFKVAFSESNDLISPGFPRPALQMEFDGFIPWVLDERRNYLDNLTP